jgi:hypothetical protein
MTGPGYSRRLTVRSSRFKLLVLDSHKGQWQKQGTSVPSSSTVLYQQGEDPRENNSSVQKSLQSRQLFVLTKHADLGPVDMEMVIITGVHNSPKI